MLISLKPYAVGFVIALACSYAVNYYDRRAYVMIPLLVLAIVGFAIFAATDISDPNPRFGSLFCKPCPIHQRRLAHMRLSGCYRCLPSGTIRACLGSQQHSERLPYARKTISDRVNLKAPDTARGVAIAMVVSVGTIGAIVATWSVIMGESIKARLIVVLQVFPSIFRSFLQGSRIHQLVNLSFAVAVLT